VLQVGNGANGNLNGWYLSLGLQGLPVLGIIENILLRCAYRVSSWPLPFRYLSSKHISSEHSVSYPFVRFHGDECVGIPSLSAAYASVLKMNCRWRNVPEHRAASLWADTNDGLGCEFLGGAGPFVSLSGHI